MKTPTATSNYAPYGWIIDVDMIKDDGAKPGTNANATGLTGPRDISPEHERLLKEGAGTKFRMKDDDGEVYYTGRIIGRDRSFDPLDDFGTPNAGATSIEYLEQGEWEAL